MAASPEPRAVPLLAAGVVLATLGWFFPLFRIVPLREPGARTGVSAHTESRSVAFDPTAAAAQVWNTDLRPAADRAPALADLAPLLRQDPAAARRQFGRSSGLGATYFFVRGSGTVVARERSQLHLALDGAEGTVVALRLGPLFGNTLRDGSGLLDVNAYPGLQEFNALAAALNALAETEVLPALRDRAQPGTRVRFAGCAEAPDTAPAAGEPLLVLVPVFAEVGP